MLVAPEAADRSILMLLMTKSIKRTALAMIGVVVVQLGALGSVSERLDIPYMADSAGDVAVEQKCRLDLYIPEKPPEGMPVLVWFHGGGLSGGDKAAPPEREAARRLAEKGIAVASANYRLSPHVTYPVYIQDAARAVRWVTDNAGSFGANPENVYVGGYSAGGYITAMLALDQSFLEREAVSGVAGFIAVSGQMTTHFTVRAETGLRKDTVIINDAAPLGHVGPGAPRLLLISGDDDWPARLEENQFLAAALHRVAKNPPVPLVVVPDRNHGTILSRFLTEGDPAGAAVLRFMSPDDSTDQSN